MLKILLSSDHCSHCSCKSVWGIIWSHWSHNPSFALFFPNWPDGRLTTRTIPSKACQRNGRSTKEPEVFEIQIKTNCSNHVPTSPFVSAFSWFQKQRGRVCCFLSCLLFSSFFNFPLLTTFTFHLFCFLFNFMTTLFCSHRTKRNSGIIKIETPPRESNFPLPDLVYYPFRVSWDITTRFIRSPWSNSK